jgi:hypothetical protein
MSYFDGSIPKKSIRLKQVRGIAPAACYRWGSTQGAHKSSMTTIASTPADSPSTAGEVITITMMIILGIIPVGTMTLMPNSRDGHHCRSSKG